MRIVYYRVLKNEKKSNFSICSFIIIITVNI